MRIKAGDTNAWEYFPYLNGEKILNCSEVDTERQELTVNYGEDHLFLLGRENQYEVKQGIVQVLHVDLVPAVEKVREELIKAFQTRNPMAPAMEELANRIITCLAIEKVNHELDNRNSDETIGFETALYFTVEHFKEVMK